MSIFDDLIEDSENITLEHSSMSHHKFKDGSKHITKNNCNKKELKNIAGKLNQLLVLNGVRNELFTTGVIYYGKGEQINSSLEAYGLTSVLNTKYMTKDPSKISLEENIDALDKTIYETRNALITLCVSVASNISEDIARMTVYYEVIYNEIVTPYKNLIKDCSADIVRYNNSEKILPMEGKVNINIKTTPLAILMSLSNANVLYPPYKEGMLIGMINTLYQLLNNNKELISSISKINSLETSSETIIINTITLNDIVTFVKSDKLEPYFESIMTSLKIDYLPLVDTFVELGLSNDAVSHDIIKSVSESDHYLSVINTLRDSIKPFLAITSTILRIIE